MPHGGVRVTVDERFGRETKAKHFRQPAEVVKCKTAGNSENAVAAAIRQQRGALFQVACNTNVLSIFLFYGLM